MCLKNENFFRIIFFFSVWYKWRNGGVWKKRENFSHDCATSCLLTNLTSVVFPALKYFCVYIFLLLLFKRSIKKHWNKFSILNVINEWFLHYLLFVSNLKYNVLRWFVINYYIKWSCYTTGYSTNHTKFNFLSILGKLQSNWIGKCPQKPITIISDSGKFFNQKKLSLSSPTIHDILVFVFETNAVAKKP